MAASLSQPGPAALFAAVARSRAQGWEDVVEGVRPFLTQVTQRLAAQVDAFEPEIAEYARYALDNQGKQLRPSLVALAGGSCGQLNDEHVSLAAIIEMIHLATLVHDDIMDGASLRRGRSTLAMRWGNDIAVLVGDCLFAHALKLAASFNTADVCRSVALSTHVVCAG
ncbi:MAG: polyprenyl synthetase family protein, partial [Verrucomicrobiota bacterium]